MWCVDFAHIVCSISAPTCCTRHVSSTRPSSPGRPWRDWWRSSSLAVSSQCSPGESCPSACLPTSLSVCLPACLSVCRCYDLMFVVMKLMVEIVTGESFYYLLTVLVRFAGILCLFNYQELYLVLLFRKKSCSRCEVQEHFF